MEIFFVLSFEFVRAVEFFVFFFLHSISATCTSDWSYKLRIWSNVNEQWCVPYNLYTIISRNFHYILSDCVFLIFSIRYLCLFFFLNFLRYAFAVGVNDESLMLKFYGSHKQTKKFFSLADKSMSKLISRNNLCYFCFFSMWWAHLLLGVKLRRHRQCQWNFLEIGLGKFFKWVQNFIKIFATWIVYRFMRCIHKIRTWRFNV